ncbi:unnamed protein product [Rhizoctonia solani]|uniref:DUF6535 domain-containing protein n=1 Tax=Rhizoctonia solani TaxID=456999 RepID=A0A8H3AUX2_9AGAM|nr:unnamed protein product [Rhizoctonia solani]
MEEKSAKKDDSPNPMQNAMRFLKRNLAPEENKEGDDAPKPKATPQERLYAGNNVPFDFRRPRDHMASDRLGEELNSEATIWTLYLDEAQEHDRELVEGRQRSLDTLLLFAALFSAILTAFLIEAKDLLQQDPADASLTLLLIIAQSQQRIELGLPAPEASTKVVAMPDFTPSLSARWVNGIWFMSLGLSLSAALIAMLGKEWLTTFHSSRPRSARRLAFIRQSRLKGLEDWGALHIIALLPTLLHMSLLLFSVGLVVYLWALDTALAAVLAGVIGLTLAFYFVTGVLGALFEFCPFVTEVSEYMQKAAEALSILPKKDTNTESIAPSIKDLQALVWLSEHSGDPIIVDYAYQSMAGLYLSPYIELDSKQARPNLDSNPSIPDEINVFGHGVTMDSLLLKLAGRYDDLLVGTLETGSVDPPVCRYINAMMAIKLYGGKLSDETLMHWIGFLEKINELWTSNLPQRSLSGSNFAGTLIAEMDVFKLAMDPLSPAVPISSSTPVVVISTLSISHRLAPNSVKPPATPS